MNDARAMLDALMGPQRDVAKKNRKDTADDWKNDSVCKSYLAGFCPYDKEVLGGHRSIKVCSKIHSEAIRERFLKHPDGEAGGEVRRGYEKDILEECEDLIAACENFSRKELNRVRDGSKQAKLPKSVLEKIEQLKREAADITRRAELLEKEATAGGGYKNLSMTWMRAAKEKMDEADDLERSEQKKLAESIQPRACKVCGCVFIDESKYDAHLSFDVHEGYKLVRDKLDELDKKRNRRGKVNKDRKGRSEDDSASGSRDRRGGRSREGRSRGDKRTETGRSRGVAHRKQGRLDESRSRSRRPRQDYDDAMRRGSRR